MEWYINDLSLNGEFSDPHALRASVEPVLRLMTSRPDLRRRILCSRAFSIRPATATLNFSECVRATNDRLFIRQILQWVSSAGPFWDDDRAANPDDYFHFEGEDVTEQGLGEAARRLALGVPAATFSFPHPTILRFQRTPLRVNHGLAEDPLGFYDVQNCWTPEHVEAAAIQRIHSWRDLLEIAAGDMKTLILAEGIITQLAPVPFHSGVAEKFLQLLRVLHELANASREGAFSSAAFEIYNKFFTGEKALFTDESETNKRDFAQELTFRDPVDPRGKPLFCSWHGKVKFGGQYRIHFEWPRPKGQRHIKVVYIGPKITKH
jgi:hypothetical protein